MRRLTWLILALLVPALALALVPGTTPAQTKMVRAVVMSGLKG